MALSHDPSSEVSLLRAELASLRSEVQSLRELIPTSPTGHATVGVPQKHSRALSESTTGPQLQLRGATSVATLKGKQDALEFTVGKGQASFEVTPSGTATMGDIGVSGLLYSSSEQSSMNGKAQARFRPADADETLWFDFNEVRALGAQPRATYFVRLAKFPFSRATRMALTYKSATHSEQGGIIDCLVPSYVSFHPGSYGTAEAGNTIYCEVTNHGLVGQSQAVQELLYVKSHKSDTSMREIWLKIQDASPTTTTATRISSKCAAHSEVCALPVNYSEPTGFVTSESNITMANDGSAGVVFDRMTIVEGAKTTGPQAISKLSSVAAESVSTSGDIEVGGTLSSAVTSSVSSGKAVFRPADADEYLFFSYSTARSKLSQPARATVYVRLASFPFGRSTRMALSYRSVAHSEQSGIIDCLVPTYANCAASRIQTQPLPPCSACGTAFVRIRFPERVPIVLRLYSFPAGDSCSIKLWQCSEWEHHLLRDHQPWPHWPEPGRAGDAICQGVQVITYWQARDLAQDSGCR